MKILRSINDLSSVPGPIVLGVGTFDGLHLGHQSLIRRSMEEAKKRGGTAVVMTFDRHPASVVRPEHSPGLLTTVDLKLRLLERMGVEFVLILEFNKTFAATPAEKFVSAIAHSANPLAMICTGSRWSFGKGGVGSIALLEEFGGELGFSVLKIDPLGIGGKPISSTRIRDAVASGDLAEACACLGRPYLLSGTVVSGAGLGSRIGFPTANLDVRGMQLPPNGVYAVRVHTDDNDFAGVANIGVRPTVNSTGSRRTIEVHLFSFSENLSGRELNVEFLKFLRPEEKFPSITALTAQIARDCETAKEVSISEYVPPTFSGMGTGV